MGEQQNLIRTLTVVTLFLQTIFLFTFAALAFLDSTVSSGGLSGGWAQIASFYFAVLGGIALWLTGEHYTETVKRRTLQTWVLICIILTSYPLIALSGIFILYPSIHSLTSLIPVLCFLLLTILVLLFSSKEST